MIVTSAFESSVNILITSSYILNKIRVMVQKLNETRFDHDRY
uniref:Uncharacterized protein n=1 Tax=Anguilla anguilla TaxID=7936 RepID=A0A0E9UC73_ANGAN